MSTRLLSEHEDFDTEKVVVSEKKALGRFNPIDLYAMLELTFVLQVRAVKKMEKGEEVTQSYLTGKLCTRYLGCS